MEEKVLRKYYSSRYESTRKSLGWSAWSQKLRYEIILSEMRQFGESLFEPGFTIFDAGCGEGFFLEFLHEQGLDPSYIGVDLMHEFVASCRAKFPDQVFQVTNILRDDLNVNCDVAVCCGVISHMDTPQALMVIEKLYEICRHGVIVNSASMMTDAEYMQDFLHHHDLGYFTQRLQHDVTRYVRSRHDYLPHDWTLTLINSMDL